MVARDHRAHVYARQPIPEALARLALQQDGVVTREQAVAHGLCSAAITRLIREGFWTRLARGTYLTASTPPAWPALACAGVLIGGDAARLGGLAAAHLHGLTVDPPPAIEVLIPHGRSVPTASGPWRFQRERRHARQPRTVGLPARLTIEDTVLDLISDPDCSERDAVSWLAMAVQARRTTPKRILQAAEWRHFLPRRTLIDRTLAAVVAGARSPIEIDYLNLVERAHGLPQGRRQQSRRGTEVDVLYEEFVLLVELDGRLGHEGMGRFRDMRRDNASTSDGFATLRYGKADVFGVPCEVAREVGRNLMLRGWEGPGYPCQNCRNVV